MPSPPPPEGFSPLGLTSEFIKLAGPMFARHGAGRVDLGFRVEERHCNIWKNCHGGWLSTLADV
ncbi:MAG: PaaI family thioesterase, partial [Hyphomicrobiales bacterium]